MPDNVDFIQEQQAELLERQINAARVKHCGASALVCEECDAPICQHAAHARTSRYITDTTKERYHQCQNVNCSATFITYESVQRYIVKPGEVHAVRPHPLPSGQQIMWM